MPDEPVDTALYFPNIRVPKKPWFTQVLLYWERAAAIVPAEIAYGPDPYSPDRLGPYMGQLKELQLVDFVFPDQTLIYQMSEDIARRFVEDVDRGKPPSEERRSYVNLHIDKMSIELFQELRARGLAKTGPSSFWWEIEKRTANVYMAYLASVICGARDGMVPVTDTLYALSTLGPQSRSKMEQFSELKYATIRHALPVPAGPVSPVELKAFKEKHADELKQCREYLDAQLATVADIEDPQLRAKAEKGVLNGVEREIARLKEQMEKRKWPPIALAGFAGVAGAALTTAGTILTGGAPLVIGILVGGGLLAGGAAAPDLIDKIKAPRYDRTSPLAYAALAGRL